MLFESATIVNRDHNSKMEAPASSPEAPAPEGQSPAPAIAPVAPNESPAPAPPAKQVHSLVIDANAIIRNDPPVSTLISQAEQLYTIPAVVSESMCPSWLRGMFNVLTHDLQFAMRQQGPVWRQRSSHSSSSDPRAPAPFSL